MHEVLYITDVPIFRECAIDNKFINDDFIATFSTLFLYWNTANKLINAVKKRIRFYFKFYSLVIWQPMNPYCMYFCFFTCLNICITISNKYSVFIFHT